MRKFLLCTILVFTVLPAWASADDSAAIEEAKTVAGSWLEEIDAGKYAEAWDQAAPIVQTAVTKTDWEKALKVARTPLGSLKSRKLKSATFTKTLPGAPDGQYVVILYETQFENKASATETVTPALDKEGKWKVSGYYIK
jgi:hypothetical protein